ncbi:COG1470 family protein [Anabaena subtropica]|uniref:Uncharacterized protein n=1 Tax=Anabaena subtropica FACHB-260 TaxID=2692884 RepID=A0ABR8CLQ9_9NOST|nr:hypothetical protein [Anabaena subtropica]MBD2343778.1 hypothetical protein [Anabaena subtropica FACHB-260]
MEFQSHPLQVIINPPGIQSGMPGDTVELNVVVINLGEQSAVINFFLAFDETFQKITGWLTSPRESRAIAPQQSSDEVTFKFDIPVDALPGTYDYTLVIDSPEHYPQETPINFPNQIKVLLKEQTVIRANDPTFSIHPASNPDKQLIYKPDEPLQVVVKIENRSLRVDRFRLTCPDLDEEWLRISYPTTGFEGQGLSDVTALELNPGSLGQILLEFRPPTNTLAGNYSPTIRLHSENYLDLVLLDLVYIQISPNYTLDTQINTILGRVGRHSGKYQLLFFNKGNVVREFTFSAKNQEEEELLIYKFDPAEIKLLPTKNTEVNLAIKPRHWWRRPWFGAPLEMNFQVNIIDKQNLPLKDSSLPGILIWKARPWWQFLLLILIILGLLAGGGFVIWRILNPDPLKVKTFSSDSRKITEGEDEVRLNWEISNYKQLRNFVVTIKEPATNEPLFNNDKLPELLKSENNESSPCRVTPQQELICNRVRTGIKTKGKYVFELKASYQQGISFFSRRPLQTDIQNTEVEIIEKPIAEITELKADKQQYIKGNSIVLSLGITRPELLAKLEIVGRSEDKIQAGQPVSYRLNNGVIDNPQLKSACKEQNKVLRCSIPVIASQVGNFIYEIKAFSNNGSNRINIKQTENKIEILPPEFQIESFRINNSEQLNLVLNEGDNALITWKVKGEDIQVELLGSTRLPSGEIRLPVNQAFPSEITLRVSDKFGKRPPQQKTFFIAVKKIEPTPAPIPPVSLPNDNPFIEPPLPPR